MVTAACTFSTVIAPLVQLGVKPIFVDVDPGTCVLSHLFNSSRAFSNPSQPFSRFRRPAHRLLTPSHRPLSGMCRPSIRSSQRSLPRRA